MNPRRHRGFSLTDLMALLAVLAALLAIIAPGLGQGAERSRRSVSMDNLRVLDQALECYARDWNDRQWTAVPDDLAVVGSDCNQHEAARGWHPAIILGWDCEGTGLWAYWPTSCGNERLGRPIVLDLDFAVGSFRLVNAWPLHDYVDGRVYDRRFYAPSDEPAWSQVVPLTGMPCEFVPTGGQIPSSYVLSPAGMYHPDVLRRPSRGGFQSPDSFDLGYESPSITQVKHASLKTRLIEHHWLDAPPGDCNPAWEDPFGYAPCNPYLFNHGAEATPLALFFDGSVSHLRTGDVVADDQRVMDATGDGLWSRDTPFGPKGYFGSASFDDTLTSHHILTTDGIRGRDRLD